MKRHQKWYLAAIVCAVFAVVTAGTIIGPVVFILLGIGATLTGYAIEQDDGDSPITPDV